MCKLCAVAPIDFEIPPVRAKYNRNRFINKTIFVGKGEFVLDEIRKVVKDTFEQLAIYDLYLSSIPASEFTFEERGEAPKIKIVKEGVSEEILVFERALTYLQEHNPTRMKTLEQLEAHYNKAVQSVKQQLDSALSSLHTRQALEMDMINNQVGGHQKADLETLVNQHVTEMESVLSHWRQQVRQLQQRQLKEYKELVMEVFESEKGKETSHPLIVKKRVYCRPQLTEAEFVRMMPIAIRPDPVKPVRVLRVTEFIGDYISAVFRPGLSDMSDLDPEEQCLRFPKVKSAAIMGTHADLLAQANQRVELLNLIDSACSADSRYPPFQDQLESVKSIDKGQIAITRHSNLGNGVSVIFHILDCDEAVFEYLLRICDSLGIKRIFSPHIIVPDLRVPSVTGAHLSVQPILISAARRLANFISNPSLDEIVFINP